MIKYIDDLREVYKLLKEGIAVYCKNCNCRLEMPAEGNEIYKFNNCDKLIQIGTPLCDLEKYYIDVQEPVKLEPGKLYKTRDDRKVICYYRERFNCGRDKFWMMEVGKCINPKRYDVYSEGNQFDGKKSTDDIINYWE